jgi:hypothetical protein
VLVMHISCNACSRYCSSQCYSLFIFLKNRYLVKKYILQLLKELEAVVVAIEAVMSSELI